MIRTLGLASLLFAGCAMQDGGTTPGTDELAGENGQDGEAAKADGIDTFGLFTVTKIGAFECNGAGSCTHLELARAGRSTMICADGTTDGTCEARTFDLSSLGLTSSQTTKVMTALQASANDGEAHLMVKGTFIHGTNPTQPDIDWVTFAPTQIWISKLATGTVDGTFVLVTDNGKRCITAPCSTLTETRLNSVRHLDIDGLDWGGDDGLASVGDAIAAGKGAIVVGSRTHGSINGAATTERAVNQVYLRLK